MRSALRLLSLLLAAVLLCSCAPAVKSLIPAQKIEDSTLYVKKVENIADGFIFGMDASCVPALEASGVVYHGFDGEEKDVFAVLAESGVTHIRVRVWNDPYDGDGNGYGGGNCDIDNCVAIGKRATAVGMKLIVDFHYSDFWADPGKQKAPKAWAGMDAEEKARALGEYTESSLKKLKDADVAVGMVQLGNETNGRLCGESAWLNISALMNSGAAAVRKIFPDALVAVHFANPEKADAYDLYARSLDYFKVDYDVFASSYYPYWHGTLDNLASVLSSIADKFGKKVMVMETSYAFTDEDSDLSGNTVSSGGAITKSYPFTVQGQANSVRDVIDTVANRTVNGIGVVYWEGTWIGVGTDSYEENSVLWQKYGSGWASSFAASYDPDDAGKYYGGCAVDNQAMFDKDGCPLESLRIFNLVKYGNEVELKPDAIEDTELIFDISESPVLPGKVNAVMTDGSKQPVDVVWDATEDDISLMRTGEPGKFTVTGDAGGMPAVCRISTVEYNYLENYSFETGDLYGWKLTEYGHANELYVEDKQTDSLTGTRHMHFWSAAADSVEFELSQELTGLAPGRYKFTISIMGGDGGETEIYAFAKTDGETVATAPMEITVYNEWDTQRVSGIEVTEGQTLTVGIYVKCGGAGNGAWGKIDDAMLNSDN